MRTARLRPEALPEGGGPTRVDHTGAGRAWAGLGGHVRARDLWRLTWTRTGVQHSSAPPTIERARHRSGEVQHVLGLPEGITVCLFDMDGVLTDTASVHSSAWKQAFDEFLKARDGDAFKPFSQDDYEEYVDGKPRADGVRDFLASRDIRLPEGEPGDPVDAATVNGVGNRKNDLLLAKIHTDGVRVYEGSRRYLQAAQAAGLRRFVVSSSANTTDVLEVTGLASLVEGQIDGNTLRQQHIKGKPAPDSFLAGAALAGVEPAAAVVFEDAVAGVQAGHDGRFGYVVGVNRLGDQHAADLRSHGATVVVGDLAQLLEAS